MSSASASARFAPTTLGMAIVLGPLDTCRVTVLPFGSGVPAAGSVPTTLPTGTVSWGTLTWVTWNPAAPSVAAAAAGSWVVTSGTGINGSRATTTVTVGGPPWGSLATGPPAAGSLRSTVPGG